MTGGHLPRHDWTGVARANLTPTELKMALETKYLTGEVALEQGGKVVHKQIRVPERAWELGSLTSEHAADTRDWKIDKYAERPEMLLGKLPVAPKLEAPVIPDLTAANAAVEVTLLWTGKAVSRKFFKLSGKKSVVVGDEEGADFHVPESFGRDGGAFTLVSGSGRDVSVTVPAGTNAVLTRAKSGNSSPLTGAHTLEPGEVVTIESGAIGFRVALVPQEGAPIGAAASQSDYTLYGIILAALLIMIVAVALIVKFAPPMTNQSEEDIKKAAKKFTSLVVKEEKKEPEKPKVDKGPATDKPVNNNNIKTNPKTKPDPKKALSSGILGALTAGGAVDNVFGGGGLGVGINSALSGLTGMRIGGGDAMGGLGARGAGAGGGGVAGIGGMGLGGPGGGKYGGNISLAGSGGKNMEDITPGRVVTKGGLDRDVIARVIKKYQRQIKFCYEKELTKNPNLYGKIVTFFVIAADGSVQTASVVETEMNSEPVESCIVRNIQRWRFPAPKGGGSVEVRYPWVFKSAG